MYVGDATSASLGDDEGATAVSVEEGREDEDEDEGDCMGDDSGTGNYYSPVLWSHISLTTMSTYRSSQSVQEAEPVAHKARLNENHDLTDTQVLL
ncbi:hypothetical protein Pelo_11194 [Pelomyxa schiedti]|nr:hypothetical protein Pelo_11194 [Pelomyxa schiedti]